MPGMDPKRALNNEVVERKSFIFTSVEDRVRFQLQLLTTSLKRGRKMWMPDDLWTQVGILGRNSASTTDFIWSQEHISVIQIVLVLVLNIVVVVPLLLKLKRVFLT